LAVFAIVFGFLCIFCAIRLIHHGLDILDGNVFFRARQGSRGAWLLYRTYRSRGIGGSRAGAKHVPFEFSLGVPHPH
jgi:hypothetical protein